MRSGVVSNGGAVPPRVAACVVLGLKQRWEGDKERAGRRKGEGT